MTVEHDLAHARSLVGELRRTVLSLAAAYGDTVDVRRAKDDLARLSADVDLLAAAPPRTRPAVEAEIVYIPDDDYASDFWADSETDDGLGAPGRR